MESMCESFSCKAGFEQKFTLFDFDCGDVTCGCVQRVRHCTSMAQYPHTLYNHPHTNHHRRLTQMHGQRQRNCILIS